MSYQIIITDPAEEAMYQRAREIAEDSGSIDVAMRWLDQVIESTQRLAVWPKSAEVTEESLELGYELRRLVVGNYLVIYRVDDDKQQVIVVSFRHGARRNPALGDTPDEELDS